MPLHDVLTTRRDEVLHRWQERVRGTLTPAAVPTAELVNHLPKFVREIIAALRADVGLASLEDPPEETSTAAGHGEQRLRLGFSLDAVVREYGVLRDALLTTAREAGYEITLRESQVVFDGIITGIAQAVTEYAQQRDAELARQANEHFAFVAHELRDPLSTATMAFAQLEEAGLLPEKRAVGALRRGLQRTAELIDQTLRIARVASGIDVRRESTTLAAVFDDAELGVISQAEAKGVEVRRTLVEDARIELDLRLVHSAVANLLRNAVKYSHGGCVVELRGRVADGRAVIEVEDRCGGLDPGQVEQAFAPFVRLDDRQSGFGLGLAIAKQAADAHGGTIRVQNLPGKGCIFVLELPASAA